LGRYTFSYIACWVSGRRSRIPRLVALMGSPYFLRGNAAFSVDSPALSWLRDGHW
jgi:hypothetical protein